MDKLNIDICIPTKYGVDPSFIELLRSETEGSIHVSTKDGLVPARIDLIKKVKTEFFLFLDDDIIYPKGLLILLYGYMLHGSNVYIKQHDLTLPTLPIGAVQGSVSTIGLGDKWDLALNKISLDVPISFADRLFGSNMLIRSSLVKDWIPNLNLSGCEDWDLTRHIRSKKYLCLTVPSKVLHKRTWKKTKINALWFGKSYPNMFKTFPYIYFFKLFGVIIKSILKLPFTFRLSCYSIYQNMYILKGMLLKYVK